MVVGASGRACTYLGEGKDEDKGESKDEGKSEGKGEDNGEAKGWGLLRSSRVQWAMRWHVKQARVVGELAIKRVGGMRLG